MRVGYNRPIRLFLASITGILSQKYSDIPFFGYYFVTNTLQNRGDGDFVIFCIET